MVTILFFGIIFSPVLALMLLIMSTAIYHTCAIIMKGKGSFDITFKIICYSSAVDIMNFVPCIGPFFVLVYKIIVMAYGFKELHQTTMNRGILITLLPVIFSVAIAVVIVMMVIMIVLLLKIL
jgi:hypothetical protein